MWKKLDKVDQQKKNQRCGYHEHGLDFPGYSSSLDAEES